MLKPFERRFLDHFTSAIKEDRGSVEAGLTLIPLTILFLASAQLVFAAQWGGAQQMRQQSDTNRVAITGSVGLFGREPTLSRGNSGTASVQYLPLLGGGHLVISERSQPVPLIANFSGLNGQQFFFRKRVAAVSEVFTR